MCVRFTVSCESDFRTVLVMVLVRPALYATTDPRTFIHALSYSFSRLLARHTSRTRQPLSHCQPLALLTLD